MAERAKTKRLSKVAREFNVGIQTLIEFLASKGVELESNPNTKIEGEVYSILLNEFQSEKSAKEESKKVSIGTEKETITLEQVQGTTEEKEEITQPEEEKVEQKKPEEELKVVGKIDLDKLNLKSRPDKKSEEKKKEEAKKDVKEEKVEEVDSEKEEEVKASKEEIKTKFEKLDSPKVLGKIDLPKEKKPVASSSGEVENQNKKKRRKKG
jgi:translation initiation factor IF-2